MLTNKIALISHKRSSTSVLLKKRQCVLCEVGIECLITACLYSRNGRPINVVSVCIQNCRVERMRLSAVVITELVCSAAVCRPLSELHEYLTNEGDVSGVGYVASELVCVRWRHCWHAVHWRNMKAVTSVFCVHRTWVRVPVHTRADVMAWVCS
jgi:hypothetical protein